MQRIIELGCLTHIGLKRNKNEDAAAAVRGDGFVLLMVADGIGGHRKGEVASDTAISIVQEQITHSTKELTSSRAKKLMKTAIKSANKVVNDLSTKPEYLDMGTTLVTALVLKGKTLVTNIGDSRLYRYDRATGLKKITVDQTYVEFMVQSGKMTAAEAALSPKRNVLLNAVGINPSTYYDEFDLENDYDALLLCSDGLYNMLSDAEIEAVLSLEASVSFKVNKLIDLANDHGGLDNIGVSLMEVSR